MRKPIYLDYNATTPVDASVIEAMLPFLGQRFGNASSTHAYGYEAHVAMDAARQQVAALIGARPTEVVFTGGGSETDNLAIKGTVFSRLPAHSHVITTAVEHPAVLNTLAYLKHRFQVEYTLLPVDEYGLVSIDALQQAIRPDTVLVTVMHGNNEVGTLQPLDQIARVTQTAGILLHADAAQSAGKVAIDVEALGIDLLTIAGHKLYAPKGIGALYIRNGVRIDPLIHGSSQEFGMRAGTENVASAVALGKACEIARSELASDREALVRLRDELHDQLLQRISGLCLNGHPTRRLPNTLNVSFPGVLGQTVLDYAPDVAASTGSACHSALTQPSPVLSAMGLTRERALGAVRLSLGRWSTREDVVQAAEQLADAFHAASAMALGAN
jgi:cysteine desulfurase